MGFGLEDAFEGEDVAVAAGFVDVCAGEGWRFGGLFVDFGDEGVVEGDAGAGETDLGLECFCEV